MVYFPLKWDKVGNMKIVKRTYTVHFKNNKLPLEFLVLCNKKIGRRVKVKRA